MEISEGKQRIGIDLDEVVFEFMKKYLEFCNKKYGSSINFQDVSDYHLWKCGIHKSREEDIEKVKAFQDSEEFDKIEFVEGVREALTEIDKNYEFYFITSRPEEIKEKTIFSLNQLFDGIKFNLHFSGGPWSSENKSKGELCNDFGIRVIVEDNPDYALDCAEKGVMVFLIDKPWNKNHKEHENIIKIKTWEEILSFLRKEK